MSWLLYVLVFVFGYVTCQTFYFLKSARLSLVLLRAAHIIYLSIIMKAIEQLSFSRGIVLENMLRTGKGSAEISMFEMRHEEDIEHLKTRSIDLLRNIHPEFFQKMMEFETWGEASEYADKHRDIIFKFWEK